MKKQTVKDAGGLCLCWMGLMAAVCVPSFIAGVMCTKSGGPAALVKASVGGVEDDIPLLSGAANPAAGHVKAGQPGRLQTAQMHATTDDPCPESRSRDANDTTTCGREIRTGETLSHTHRHALRSGVGYVNVTTCDK